MAAGSEEGALVRGGRQGPRPSMDRSLFGVGRPVGGPAFPGLEEDLQRLDVRSLQALGALLDFEFNLLAFCQGTETATVADLAVVGEKVLAAVSGRDEAEALAIVEPLDGAGLDAAHGVFFQK